MEFLLYPILILSLLFFSGLWVLSTLPEFDRSEILFRDRRASGFNSKFRLCGAAFTLDVVVTQKELILKTGPLLAGIALSFDLLHHIPLRRINAVKRGRIWTIVEFETENGGKKQVFLWVRDQKDFISFFGECFEKMNKARMENPGDSGSAPLL